jgi:hypothetical protein
MTGMPPEEFENYLPQFSAAYHKLYPIQDAGSDPSSQQPDGPSVPAALAQMEDKLLFIWLAYRMKMPPAALAQQFGLGASQVYGCIGQLLPVLDLALYNLSIAGLPPNCVRFLQLLNANEVEYLVVGGRAVAFHGYRRPILDLDIFVATHPQNAMRLVRVLQAFGDCPDPRVLECFQAPERVIRIGQSPFTLERYGADDRMIELGLHPTQVEVLTSISAVTFEECYPARVAGIMDGVPVQVIGLAHFKVNKLASIRTKDADDLAHLSE